ncbi:MAG TPA: hypothetical protein VIK66_13480 [Gaiellaceae bacterium]
MITAAPPPPARVQVVAQEFRFTLSRAVIKHGWAVIELRNLGEDAHDLRLRRVGGTRVYVWRVAQPGQTIDKELKLVPGSYRLTCGVANHARLGMVATLHVR